MQIEYLGIPILMMFSFFHMQITRLVLWISNQSSTFGKLNDEDLSGKWYIRDFPNYCTTYKTIFSEMILK